MKPVIRLATALIVIPLLASCKTHVAALQHHPSFTFASVTQHAFVDAGVASSVRQLGAAQRVRYGDLLARTFLEENPALRIISTGQLLQKTGLEPFDLQLNTYRLTGVISEDHVEHVRQAFPQARYLMVCRVEKNIVSQRHEEAETDVADSSEDQKKGEYERVRVDVSLTTTREMGATLSI